jgi:hypothetical protein
MISNKYWKHDVEDNAFALMNLASRFGRRPGSEELKPLKERWAEYLKDASKRWKGEGLVLPFKYGNVAEWAGTLGFVFFAPPIYESVTGKEFFSSEASSFREFYRATSMLLLGAKFIAPGLKDRGYLYQEWFTNKGKAFTPWQLVGSLAQETGHLVPQLVTFMPLYPWFQDWVYRSGNSATGAFLREMFDVEKIPVTISDKVLNEIRVLQNNPQALEKFISANFKAAVQEKIRASIYNINRSSYRAVDKLS